MDDWLERELRDLLANGQKIEAIARFREVTSVGLAEAKAAVEALERGHSVVSSNHANLTSGTVETILQLLKDGQKIDAIKFCRDQTGLGLRESKEMIEEIGTRFGIEAKKAGCLGLVLATFVVEEMFRASWSWSS